MWRVKMPDKEDWKLILTDNMGSTFYTVPVPNDPGFEEQSFWTQRGEWEVVVTVRRIEA